MTPADRCSSTGADHRLGRTWVGPDLEPRASCDACGTVFREGMVPEVFDAGAELRREVYKTYGAWDITKIRELAELVETRVPGEAMLEAPEQSTGVKAGTTRPAPEVGDTPTGAVEGLRRVAVQLRHLSIDQLSGREHERPALLQALAADIDAAITALATPGASQTAQPDRWMGMEAAKLSMREMAEALHGALAGCRELERDTCGTCEAMVMCLVKFRASQPAETRQQEEP